MTVRRLVTPEEAARAVRRGVEPGRVMTPEQVDILSRRAARQRGFRHHLSVPAVDWSPHARRRRGWSMPQGPLRDPHARVTGSRHAAAAGSDVVAGGAVDTVRIAFIRVDFRNDRGGASSTGDGRFDLTGPDLTLPPIDRAPHNRSFYLDHLEALHRYYDATSYGAVRIEGDVWPRDENSAYTVSDMADFGPWAFNQEIYRAAVDMFRTMMFAADSQATNRFGDTIPWDTYDRFMIIHAGSDLQSDLRGDSELDIPSFTIGVGDTDVVIFPPDSTNIPIEVVAIVPETVSQDGFYAALNGVIAHENGHNIFGWADLYDVSTGLPVVGEWSLMDSGNLVGTEVNLPNGEIVFAIGLLPPSTDPFHRFFGGDRLTFVEPVWGDTTTLQNSERHPDMKRIFLSSDEYLVLENRAIAPGDTILLDQDSTSRVILGPKSPDAYEYDALLQGPGTLVWHIDASVIPFETAFRYNDDFGFNTHPRRRGISIIEADALGDLGDPGSPYILGSRFDPYWVGNYAVLSDTTKPNLIPHVGTRPHVTIEVLDPAIATMRFRATRTWQRPGWPVAADFPPEGPQLLAIDVDGDGLLEVCWAGGGAESADSTAIFAVRPNGQGMFGPSATLVNLDRRPRPLVAALAAGPTPGAGPALLAVSTYGDASGGGEVWLVDQFGVPLPGWPATLPSRVTTPPVIAGDFPSASVFVGCEDGAVYELGLDGAVVRRLAMLSAPVSGRLAVAPDGSGGFQVAAGDRAGDVAVVRTGLVCIPGNEAVCSWRRTVGGPGFEPDFLWIDFAGGQPATSQTLVAHHADRLWAFSPTGDPLAGWGMPSGDTLVAGLGAGDPDGDGFAEVLTQSRVAGVAFWNQSGRPSPGWPKRTSPESFASSAPPLAVDVDGDGRAEVVGLDAAGVLAALDAAGQSHEGWPLATGSGATGSILAADLDGDGFLELIAPDRAAADSVEFGGQIGGRFETLYAFELPVAVGAPAVTSWTMVGGDPGRTSSLPSSRTPLTPVASAGPYIEGSLKAYPNPSRKRRPISFAYQLTEPAEVTFDIVDASGHRVASFARSGRQADNLEVWDPGDAPAGLYMARLKFSSAGREHHEVVTLGVIK